MASVKQENARAGNGSQSLLPPRMLGVALCGAFFWTDDSRQGEGEYVICLLTNRHSKCQGIKPRFLASWHHPGMMPTVMRIYQVRNSQQTFARYSRYKDALVAQSQAQGEKRRGSALKVSLRLPAAKHRQTHTEMQHRRALLGASAWLM